MILLLDIGNSRIKWAVWNGRKLKRGAAIEHGGDPARTLRKISGRGVDAVWISNVMGAAHETALGRTTRRVFGVQAQFAHSQARSLGLKNAYREPQRLGVDRWLAMLGAWKIDGGALCVADAGTALTVDCVNASGRHLGGLIAPGLLTAQRAVLGATRFGTRSLKAQYSTALGRDTEACVRQGALLGCLGAIDRASVVAGAGARKIMTGGDAAALLKHLDHEWEHRPHLVLEGLLALALNSAEPPS